MINKKYNTNPLIFHAQGKPQNNKIPLIPKDTVYTPEPDMAIITFNNGHAAVGKVPGTFEKSLNNLPHTVLGANLQTWSNHLKIALTYDFLKSVQQPYVLGCDSADVILDGQPQEILRRFKNQKAKILFNAELHCWPDDTYKEFEESVTTSKFCYLNAGVWIAETKEMLKVLGWILDQDFDTGSEQAQFKAAYKQFYPAIQIDHFCNIFQTTNAVPKSWIEE